MDLSEVLRGRDSVCAFDAMMTRWTGLRFLQKADLDKPELDKQSIAEVDFHRVSWKESYLIWVTE